MRINSLQENKKITEIENKLNGLIDIFYPIGSYYETSDKNFNPNTSWGGTWKKDNSGVFLVSEDSSLILGSTGGEKTHQLTINEMPVHNHNVNYTVKSMGNAEGRLILGDNQADIGTTSGAFGTPIVNIGGGQEHNNMPPYLVVVRWHRIS